MVHNSNQLLNLKCLQTPGMAWPLADTVIYFAGYLMIESFWTPYLMKYAGATQYQAAVAFVISGGFYVLSSLVVGPVSCENIRYGYQDLHSHLVMYSAMVSPVVIEV